MEFSGSTFPDVIDLSPQILNKYLGFSLPEFDQFFRWHQHAYSGSIYGQNCNQSIIYQILTILVVVVICYFNKGKLKRLFTSNVSN